MRLFNCDYLEVTKAISTKSVDLVITDPPYLFNRGGGKTSGTEGKSKIANSELYRFGGKTMSEMGNFDKPKIYDLLNECKRICKVMRGYFFCNETALQYYLSWATENNFKYNIITLQKAPSILNRNRYSTNSEFCVRIIAKSGAGLNILDYDDLENDISWLYSVQTFDKQTHKLHPAQKPLNFIKGIIKLNTKEGDVVFDGFMGSGSTGVVCKELNRDFIGCEIDKYYFDIANERINGNDIVQLKQSKKKTVKENKFNNLPLFDDLSLF